MISKHEEIQAAISVLPAKVSYHYPQDWSKLPVISYYEITNLPESVADDREYSSELEYTVDVWAKSPAEMVALAQMVDEAMKSVGFDRAFSLELFEKDKKIYHKTMRFRGVF